MSDSFFALNKMYDPYIDGEGRPFSYTPVLIFYLADSPRGVPSVGVESQLSHQVPLRFKTFCQSPDHWRCQGESHNHRPTDRHRYGATLRACRLLPAPVRSALTQSSRTLRFYNSVSEIYVADTL